MVNVTNMFRKRSNNINHNSQGLTVIMKHLYCPRCREIWDLINFGIIYLNTTKSWKMIVTFDEKFNLAAVKGYTGALKSIVWSNQLFPASKYNSILMQYIIIIKMVYINNFRLEYCWISYSVTFMVNVTNIFCTKNEQYITILKGVQQLWSIITQGEL